MNLPNSIQEQWNWLQSIPVGTRIVAWNGVWVRPKLTGHLEGSFVNVDTGDVLHFSHLSNLAKPPRISCRPSPFESE